MNLEQLGTKSLIFEQDNYNDLAQKIKHVMGKPNEPLDYGYMDKLKIFGYNFKSVIDSI